jgi:hypothetical protein
MDWLFQGLPLRKVYHEAYGYNAPVVRMWRKLGLSEEGVLKEDRYWNGEYWDLHAFGLYREDWPGVRDRVLRAPGAGRLSLPPAELAPSNLHMWANRLLRAAHRARELILYDFLGRLYESEAARVPGRS